MGCHKLPYKEDRESLEKKHFIEGVRLEKNPKEQKITPNAYQYHLKDHLGNTRLTFTTEPKTHEFNAFYEDATTVTKDGEDISNDMDLFENMGNVFSMDIHDITDAGSTYTKAQKLTGANGAIVGSILTIPVGKGDMINATVSAKYLAATGTLNGASTVAGSLIGALSGNSAAANFEGAATSTTASSGGSFVGALGSGVNSSEPMAFINLMFLAEDATDVTSDRFSYGQITSSSNNAHASMSLPQAYEAPSSGYVIVYLSNDSDYLTEVYFDDLNVTVEESKVIQTDSYYPFGMQQAGGYQRATNLKNNFLFNQGTGDKKFMTERITDLDLNWDMTKYRTYDYTTGRFLQVDPLADAADQEILTPYHYSLINPIRWNDPLGDCTGPDCPERQSSRGTLNAALQGNVTRSLRSANNNASKVITAKIGTQAAGIGGKLKLGKFANLEATGKAFSVEGKVGTDGSNELSSSVVSVDFALQVASSGGKFSQKDGATSFSASENGVTGDIKLRDKSGSVNVGGAKHSVGDSGDSNEFSIGATIGQISGEVSANLDAAAQAVTDVVDAAKSYFSNLIGPIK